MTSDNALTFGDLSSNNSTPDLALYAKAGHQHISLKATEGTGYRWLDGNTLAQLAHGHGLHVGRYHLLTSGDDPAAQAHTFADTIRATLGRPAQPGVWPPDGDWLMGDIEAIGDNPFPGDARKALQVQTFARTVNALLPAYPLFMYLPNWYLAGRPALAKVGTQWLTIASDYDDIDVLPNPYGLTYAGWQYTDRGRLAGCPDPVDVNRWLPLGPSQTYLGNPNWRQRIMLKIARTVVSHAVAALVHGGDHGYFTAKRFGWVHPAGDGLLDRIRKLEEAQPH